MKAPVENPDAMKISDAILTDDASLDECPRALWESGCRPVRTDVHDGFVQLAFAWQRSNRADSPANFSNTVDLTRVFAYAVSLSARRVSMSRIFLLRRKKEEQEGNTPRRC